MIVYSIWNSKLFYKGSNCVFRALRCILEELKIGRIAGHSNYIEPRLHNESDDRWAYPVYDLPSRAGYYRKKPHAAAATCLPNKNGSRQQTSRKSYQSAPGSSKF